MLGEVEAIAGVFVVVVVVFVVAVVIAVVAALVDGHCYVTLSPLQLSLLLTVAAMWC